MISSLYSLTTKNVGLHDLRISDGDFNLYSRFNAHRGDLLHNFSRTVQVDESLVNPHLESIPRL